MAPNGLEVSRPASSQSVSRTRLAAAGRVGSIELLGRQPSRVLAKRRPPCRLEGSSGRFPGVLSAWKGCPSRLTRPCGEVLGIRLGAAKTQRADESAGANSGKQASFMPDSRALTFQPNHEVCSEACSKAYREGESSGIHDRQPQISPLWLDRPETGFRTDGRRDHPEKANQGGFHARPRIPGRGQGFDVLPESY
jgi:hypothetical protein